MNLCNPEGFRAEIKSMVDEPDKLFTWFDGGGDIDGAFKKAEVIFERLILSHAKKHLGKDLSDKVSMDIGYGSGAQVLAASEVFEKAFGIDVHEEHDAIMYELMSRGGDDMLDKAYLMSCDGSSIPSEDDSIDFIHSWTTFLHLVGLVNVVSYLDEIKRVLKPQGIAVIYFTRLIRSKSPQTETEYYADIILENAETVGYRYGGPLTTVRSIAMIISMWKMVELAEASGLEVIDKTFSYDGKGKKKKIYGQHGIVLRNPDPIPPPVEEDPPEEEEEGDPDKDSQSDKTPAKKPAKKYTRKKTIKRKKG
jgi:ubiquinone/menaquinone biosynthesis C-methylase UbiE